MDERDAEAPERRKQPDAFERHLQTGIQVVLTALVLWFGNKLLSVSDSTIRLEVNAAQSQEAMKDIKTEVTALRTQVLGATAAGLSSQAQIKELETRLTKIEGRR